MVRVVVLPAAMFQLHGRLTLPLQVSFVVETTADHALLGVTEMTSAPLMVGTTEYTTSCPSSWEAPLVQYPAKLLAYELVSPFTTTMLPVKVRASPGQVSAGPP